MPKTQITSSSDKVQFCSDCQEHWSQEHICYGRRVSTHQLMDKIESLKKIAQEVYMLTTGEQYKESPLAPYSTLELAKEGAAQWHEDFGGDIGWKQATSNVCIGEGKRQILKVEHNVSYLIYRMKIDPDHVSD